MLCQTEKKQGRSSSAEPWYVRIELSDRKARGEHVNEKDLKKYKHNVFRLPEFLEGG